MQGQLCWNTVIFLNSQPWFHVHGSRCFCHSPETLATRRPCYVHCSKLKAQVHLTAQNLTLTRSLALCCQNWCCASGCVPVYSQILCFYSLTTVPSDAHHCGKVRSQTKGQWETRFSVSVKLLWYIKYYNSQNWLWQPGTACFPFQSLARSQSFPHLT